MFTNFFLELRQAKVPVSLKEYLALMEALDKHVADYSVDDFYYLSRATLVKDETQPRQVRPGVRPRLQGPGDAAAEGVDRRDPRGVAAQARREVPDRRGEGADRGDGRLREADGDAEEASRGAAEAPPGRQQVDRHRPAPRRSAPTASIPKACASARTRAATAARSRSGTSASTRTSTTRSRLGTRNIKVALRRLRKFAREGAAGRARHARHHPLDGAQRRAISTSRCVPERRNKMKRAAVLRHRRLDGRPHQRLRGAVLGGAHRVQAPRVLLLPQLPLREACGRTTAAATPRPSRRLDLLHTYPPDYKVIFVGDASMSPYEITYPGGSVEHWNEEAGQVWMQRMADTYRSDGVAEPDARAALELHAVDPAAAAAGRATACSR